MTRAQGGRSWLGQVLLFVVVVASLTQENANSLGPDQPGGPSRARKDLELEAPNRTAGLASLVHFLLPGETLARVEGERDFALLELLERVGPDMKPANGFEDPKNISLGLAKRAWTRMHEHAEQVARERVDLLGPSLEFALVEANVSQSCRSAASLTLASARRLEAWAVKLINSWGSFPPVGIFEGTLGEVGSFHGCLSVRPPLSHAHYCTFSFRPVLPSRRDYELIVRQEPGELRELFGPGDAFTELAGRSQYNHYVYFKFGVCLPIECSPLDAQRLARLLGRRGILLSGPVKCFSNRAEDYEEELELGGAKPTRTKLQVSTRDVNGGIYIWKPQVSRTQLVALGCLLALSSVVLAFTLADLALNRMPRMLFDLTLVEPAGGSAPAEGEEELQLEPLTVMNHVIGPPPSEAQAETEQQEGRKRKIELDLNNNDEPAGEHIEQTQAAEPKRGQKSQREGTAGGLLAELVRDFSLITNTSEFFAVSKQQLASDILCMNGLRCLTMSWIILAHTVQYNDWSAFARIYEVESQLHSLVNQPLFNASYLVDTFFLMSGLLTSFSVFRQRRPAGRTSTRELFGQLLGSFSCRAYLVGRYLRLTPQILLVSLLFIVLPLAPAGGGPHWFSMTGEYAENCARNWWVNLLHVQAFYRPGEMCNFVCWWISVDMLYHLLALGLILAALRLGPRSLGRLCLGLGLANSLLQASLHFRLGLPPNMLATIPQTGAMWTQMTLNYFWTPRAHFLPFVFGLALGFVLALHRPRLGRLLTRGRALAGWLIALALFGAVLFGTHGWVVGGAEYSRTGSTAFALGSQLCWSLALAWTIVACQLGFGSFINSALSCRLFLVLGKASYLVYLSHFLVLFSFFGAQNLLLEPTRVMIVYLILGNICLSTLLGSLLCVAFEMPWLKIQRRIMRHVK